jgi:hypothetical protein
MQGESCARRRRRPCHTGGSISSGMEVGFHLLRRAGYGEEFIAEVARVMEYRRAYDDDIEYDFQG